MNKELFKVVDLSHHNGSVDFTQIKSSGYKGVILRAGYGKLASQRDKKFDEYYARAKSVGLYVGAYWYSYATTPSEVILEAQACTEVIKGKKFELPIFFDIEEEKSLITGKANCTSMVIRFCDYMEAKKYWVGVYASDSVFATHLDESIQSRYACWVARVENVEPTSCKKYGIWQYTWKAKVGNMTQNFDADNVYVDYPKLIKSKGLNGFTSSTSAKPSDSKVIRHKVTIKSGTWNVRSSPNITGRVITIIKGGSTYISSGQSSGWYYLDDLGGYISPSGVSSSIIIK